MSICFKSSRVDLVWPKEKTKGVPASGLPKLKEQMLPMDEMSPT